MERYLLDFLVEQCEQEGDGTIRTGEITRLKFINFMLKVSNYNGAENQIIYKDSSVKSAMHTLRKYKFLLATPNSRGIAWINPLYYGRFNKNRRKNLIKHLEKEIEEADNNLEQKKPNPLKLNFTPTEELKQAIEDRNKELWG